MGVNKKEGVTKVITEKKATEICNLIFEKQKKFNRNNAIIKNHNYATEYCRAEDDNMALRSEIMAIFKTIWILEPKAHIFTLWDKETNEETGVSINGVSYFIGLGAENSEVFSFGR